MTGRIDIGNVRGVKGDRGEKGDRGKTPSYNDIKYVKRNEEFVKRTTNCAIGHYYQDADGNICNEEGYILDENRQPTNVQGTPYNEQIYGYAYKEVWLDCDGKFTNINGEFLDKDGNVMYEETSFISDITSYMYNDKKAYDKLVGDIFPKIIDNLLVADPNDPQYKNFFDEIEGDIKYYLCIDNPYSSIIINNEEELQNTCKYLDDYGNLAVDDDNHPLFVPLEKNALYLYNGNGYFDNNIMHYDIYLCTKANTVPIKLVSSADFQVDYNVIDELKLVPGTVNVNDETDYPVYLRLTTRGTRGQFYSMDDVDTLFNNNVISKLGANYGIAQLNGNGKVPPSQLPAYVDDVVEGTMNNAETIFTPSDENYIDSVRQSGKIYVDTNTRKTYRWTGSNYVYISNPVVVADGSTEAYPNTEGEGLESIIGDDSLNTTSQTITEAINEHESDISSLNNNITSLSNNKVDKVTGKGLSTNDYTTSEKNKLNGIESEANKTIVDNALNEFSTNPVQNNIIYSALDEKVNSEDVSQSVTNGDANPVSGDAVYDSLSNKLDKNLGSENSGKYLKINNNGDITLDSISELTGITLNVEYSDGTTGTFSLLDIDSALSSSSENPVQNKVIYNAINSLTNRVGTLEDELLFIEQDLTS